MSKCCFDIRAESEYQVLNVQMLFWHSSWVRISSFKCQNAILTYFDIRAESLLRLTIFRRYYSTRAVLTFELSPNIKFYMPKCYFDIFWHSSWVIFWYYSTRGYLFFSAKKPTFDLVWDRDINHCLGTYMFSLDWIFMKLADIQDRNTVLNVFEFEPDPTFSLQSYLPLSAKSLY